MPGRNASTSFYAWKANGKSKQPVMKRRIDVVSYRAPMRNGITVCPRREPQNETARFASSSRKILQYQVPVQTKNEPQIRCLRFVHGQPINPLRGENTRKR